MGERTKLVEGDHSRRNGAADVDDPGKQDTDDYSWVICMEGKLTSIRCRSTPTFSICRVPKDIRENDPAAYSPKIVSIGPFHRSTESLKAMEEHKWRYLDGILTYSKAGNDLLKYFREMKTIEQEARRYYSGEFEMKENEFAEMMLLDGCFIIQILLHQKDDKEKMKHEFVRDPIYANSWMLPLIHHDMLLFENQLPFFVLERLWDLIKIPSNNLPSLRESALKFLQNLLPVNHDIEPPEQEPKPNHLLHLLHLSLKPTPASPPCSCEVSTERTSNPPELSRDEGNSSSSEPLLKTICPEPLNQVDQMNKSKSEHKPQSLPMMIPTVTELQEAGVEFQEKKEAGSFLAVTFEKGVMKMPPLAFSHSENTLLRNLTAFEQCFPCCGRYLTSYCILMDCLVNTPRDVQILKESNIVKHGLGCETEVALLFNKLCKGISRDINGSYLKKLFIDVNEYTENRCHRWRAKLVHDYFSNPWAIISLIAAIFVIFLTILQTIYALLTYY